jgi:hypothetical protein
MSKIPQKNNNVFDRFNCLSDRNISFEKLSSKLKEHHRKQRGKSDVKIDKRYPSELFQKFIRYNKVGFEFLKLNVVEENGKLNIISNEFVGAIPIYSPIDGKPMGDLIITPRFSDSKNAFEQIIELLPQIESTIKPDFLDTHLLSSGVNANPPLYYEATIFIDLFEKSIKSKWQKFQSKDIIFASPLSSTKWDKYAYLSTDPYKSLNYPARVNILTYDHREWQQILNVYDIAVKEVISTSTPSRIKIQYRDKLNRLNSLTAGINRIKKSHLSIKAADPILIKRLKKQGNIILNSSYSEAKAWRIDFNEFFERYCQYIFETLAKEIGGKTYSNLSYNAHFTKTRPIWSLSKLEPDILFVKDGHMFSIDSKYKAHMFNIYSNSSTLKETHRSDLHQLLAYNSFDQNKNKIGFLVYPSQEINSIKTKYTNRFNNLTNTVFFYGLPIGKKHLNQIKINLKNILISI